MPSFTLSDSFTGSAGTVDGRALPTAAYGANWWSDDPTNSQLTGSGQLNFAASSGPDANLNMPGLPADSFLTAFDITVVVDLSLQTHPDFLLYLTNTVLGGHDMSLGLIFSGGSSLMHAQLPDGSTVNSAASGTTFTLEMVLAAGTITYLVNGTPIASAALASWTVADQSMAFAYFVSLFGSNTYANGRVSSFDMTATFDSGAPPPPPFWGGYVKSFEIDT